MKETAALGAGLWVAGSTFAQESKSPNEKINIDEALERSIHDLQKCGILRDNDRILTKHSLDIKFAYVVFDEHRQANLGNLVDYLESLDILAAGRYGLWDYYSMEDSILSGKAAADKIRAKMGISD